MVWGVAFWRFLSHCVTPDPFPLNGEPVSQFLFSIHRVSPSLRDSEMAAAKAEQEEGLIEFYDSFKDMFQFFCDNTTIHGSIRLACTSKNKMKTTFWVLLFFSSFVMLYSQMGNLTAQYWNYPVNINISMSTNHKVKIFPAVTICNMNPYRFDVVNKHLVELDHLARKALSDLYGFNATESIDSEPEVTALEELLGEGSGHFNSSFHLDDSIKLERLTSDGMKPALSGTISTRMGFQLCDASGRDCYYKSYWSGVDAMREWYLYHYINIMSQIPITLNITDDEDNQALVYSCQYNGRMCSEREYAIFHHAIHGRCYTFNNNQNEDFWKASKFGIKYGLSLIVRAEQKPPLPLLSSTGGLRVIIHKHNQPVIVEHGGFNIMPGTETSISIQKDDMNWLGEPYGRCTEDGTDVDIKLLNSNAYTLQVVDLLSRMGSLWGLWFGSSVLSVAELLELVLDAVALCIIMAYRLWHPRRPAAATCNCVRAVTPIKDVSKGICRCGSQSVEVSLPDIFPTGTRLRREHFPECTLHHGISVH
ncbi:hypothetical protein NDU88_011259 [Pleurodeles waltl]|uniref:Amiloride-sensitive sodium channel subunit alpha n=1 Tax=Pleurodeles waltl TaxID=8319 RepID=A0AAV7QZJ3_PLEWA|nr:hypothetical protein NDU88_011259 [Pleurodeles waltl]